MVAIQLNGAKAQTPQSFEELKARIFQRIYKDWDLEKPILERDYFKLFCILNDCNFDRLDRTPENEVAVEELTRWVVETEPRFEVIKSFTFNGKTVEIPSDIGRLPIGQTTLVKQAIDSSRFPEQNICFAAAVYLQPLLDGSKLNYESIKKWEAVFEELPITEIFSVGFFLLSHVKKNSSGHQSVWRRIKSNLTIIRKKVLRYWLKRTGYKGLIINR